MENSMHSYQKTPSTSSTCKKDPIADKPQKTPDNLPIFSTSPKILVVEDSRLIRYVIKIHLTELGCQVDFAQDGLQAIEMFKNGYDLVLLDIGLPKMNGIDVVKNIRNYEKLDNIPRNVLIAATAFGNLVFDECKEAGFDDFYSKPILRDGLIALLKKWLPQFLVPVQNKPTLRAEIKPSNLI